MRWGVSFTEISLALVLGTDTAKTTQQGGALYFETTGHRVRMTSWRDHGGESRADGREFP